MKTGKNKKRRQHQQQGGRPVLVTFYIARPTATASAHHHSHGRGHESPRRGSKQKVDRRSQNRRAELLEYSRQLRTLARQTTTAATRPVQPPPPPRPRRRDSSMVSVVHESTSSQQKQIKQRCCGGSGGGWSWKRVLVLVFPFNSSSHGKSNKLRRRHDDGRRESNRNINQKGWPAALMLGNGRLTVSRASRDHSGLSKKLKSVFRKPW